MSNMSYCRFENTLNDLRECFEALQNRDIESVREKKKARALLEEMAEFLVNEDLINTDEYDEVNINYEGMDELIEECKDQDEE
jgi:hypothetical protein